MQQMALVVQHYTVQKAWLWTRQQRKEDSNAKTEIGMRVIDAYRLK